MFSTMLVSFVLAAPPPQSTLPETFPEAPRIQSEYKQAEKPKARANCPCGIAGYDCGCEFGAPCICAHAKLAQADKVQAEKPRMGYGLDDARADAKAKGQPLIVFVGWRPDDARDLDGCLAIKIGANNYDAENGSIVIEPVDGGNRICAKRGEVTMRQICDKALGRVAAPPPSSWGDGNPAGPRWQPAGFQPFGGFMGGGMRMGGGGMRGCSGGG